MYKDDTGEGLILACIIIGTIAGGAYGAHRAKKNGYSTKDGWNFWKYVLGYGAAGGTIGGITGWVIGKAVASKTVSAIVASTESNTITHIMKPKHAWTTVVNPVTWENISPLIKQTMLKGTKTFLGFKNGALVYETVKNEVVVRYAIIDSITKISDAWIKTR